jgi:hypothetical protein
MSHQRQILKILHSLEFSLRESAMNSGSWPTFEDNMMQAHDCISSYYAQPDAIEVLAASASW